MNPEDRELLRTIAHDVEENSKILRGMRRTTRWGTFFKLLYWIIILGIAFGAYYYIQPYIEGAQKGYNSIQNDVQSLRSLKDQVFGTNSEATTSRAQR